MQNLPDLPTPVSPHTPAQGGLWDQVEEHAQSSSHLPGFTEPSPFGPVKRADPPPEPTRSVAPEVQPPKPRTVRRAVRPVKQQPPKTEEPEQQGKVKRRLPLPNLSLKTPKIGIPAQAHALATPLACSIAFWSLAGHFAGQNTQGLVAIAIMSALPLVLLWFLIDVVYGMRVKLGVFGMVLLPVAIAFATLTTIAPYSLLALISYWLYYPATRGWLRRTSTWFCASAIAWSITIFI